jgi:hypothetical protein
MTRKVVPAAGATPSGPAVNAYEEQRNARIARNNQMLSQLGVKEAAAKVAQPAITTWRRSKPPCSKQACGEAAEATPVRLSKRLRGQATPVEEGVGGAVSVPAELDEDYGRLLSVDEFLERKGLQKGGCSQQPADTRGGCGSRLWRALCAGGASLRAPHCHSRHNWPCSRAAPNPPRPRAQAR